MRDEFQGYYRLSDQEFKELWGAGLVVPDTNVLLTLYRLREETRKRLLGIFEALSGRLFLPHQVGYEFQENRVGVIEEQEKVYGTVLGKIDEFPGVVGRNLREHPRLDAKELQTRLSEALSPVRQYVEEVRTEHPDPLADGDVIGTDVIRDVLDEVFSGRIGPPRDMNALIKEGARRYEEKRPPGYEDKRKDEPRCYGDLAIWLDTVEAAKQQSKGVILITAERKADWWWVRNGKVIGPRPELIAEMREKANQTVYLYDVERFMEEASKTLGLEEISEEERDDVARAQRIVFTTTPLQNVEQIDWSKVQLPKLDTEKIDWKIDPAELARWSAFDRSKLDFYGAPRALEWQTAAQVDGQSAAIHLALQPSLFFPEGSNGAQQISCLVQGPGERNSEAHFSNASLPVNVTYPDDFIGDVAQGEGTYFYTWLVSGVRGPLGSPVTGEVASGSFDLKAETEQFH
jgi:hypothetical protein